jgi:glycosyltransferase involved in cell wall biosynthesis
MGAGEAIGVWLFSDAAYVGGAELYLESILRADGSPRLALLARESTGNAAWLDRLQRDGLRVERFAAGSNDAARWQLQRALRRLRVRLLHVNLPGPYDGLLATAPAVAKLAGVPRVLCTEHLPAVGRVGKRYWLKRVLVPSVDRAIALCAAHREILQHTFGYARARIVVIPNGVTDRGGVALRGDLPPGAPAADAPDLRIVQLAALEQRKGGDVLIEALASLPPEAPRPHLYFVGEGERRPAWSSLAQQLGVGERVHFVGQRADARDWLAAADLVVLASAREGMPLSLLEAMEVGRPIVATAVDGVPELLAEDAGLLVPAGAVEQLAAALRRVLGDGELRQRLAQRARERFVRHYRRDQMLERTLGLYREMLA